MSSHETSYLVTIIAGKEAEIEATAHYDYFERDPGTRVDPGYPAHIQLNALMIGKIDLLDILNGDQVVEIQEELLAQHAEATGPDPDAAYEARRERQMERD